MKTTLTLVLAFLLVGLFYLVPDRALYYWEGDVKHYYSVDTSIALLEFRLDHIESRDLSEDYQEAEAVRIKDDSTIQLITRSRSKLLDRLEAKDITQYPAIRVNGTSGISFVTDEISVMFEQYKGDSDLHGFADRFGLIYLRETSYGAQIFRLRDISKTVAIANHIQENEEVIWSNPNFVHLISLHNDPLYPDQYYLNNTGQFGGTVNIDINAPEAWGLALGCDNIRVAVIDDGVENHEDFDGRVLQGFTAGSNNTNGAPVQNARAHGMACSGIIAATHNNSLGIRGIAPNSRIVPINIFPNTPVPPGAGAATNVEIAEAINWAWQPANGNAHILSNSWGGGSPNVDITNAITDARTLGRGTLGAVVIFSAGNSGTSGVTYPGTVNGVVTVGAINKNGNIWGYSSRGPQLDLVAPSGNTNLNGDVRTTDRMGTNGYESGNYTDRFGGTSGAAPQVSGVVALMLSVDPGLTETQVRTALQNSAIDMGIPGFDNTYGYGRVNAFAAVRAVLPPVNGPALLCSSNSYVLASLPPGGSSPTWSVTPTHLFSGSTSGSGTTANLSPYHHLTSGEATITFTVQTDCGPINIPRTFWVGRPATPGSIIGDTSPSVGSYKNYIVASLPAGATSMSWTLPFCFGCSQPWSFHSGQTSTQMTAVVGDPAGYVQAVGVNSCGNGGASLLYVTPDDDGPCDPCPLIFPNPVSEELVLEWKQKDGSRIDDYVNQYEVALYDMHGFKLLSGHSNASVFRMDIRSLRNGFYYLHIVSDKGLIRRQIRVEK
ncbi:putative calcium dependent protease [Indibacter alkaliphilus LW1]|uniref:Calcium dependent protease n=1 Tax=Indibacter alkaliphilus (strain CCUG 57479 / KCTC 22604 / LW1) TaxID=1189612 RepID=S2E6L7_INDAL|nr:S8 family serine peptidase [Indibacter alkaliphilus]EPA00267.1 putative calcium dependent protease [Indibacter alkaliphilus LW1]